MKKSSASVSSLRWLPLLLGGAAMALAARWIWVCDDAFISFRYAQHLVRGDGLIFNIGESVEGYTNFLWTVWIALGLAVGVAPELWTAMWGLLAFGGTVMVLARGAQDPRLPLAALLCVVSRPLQIWATGGLETSLDILLLVIGWHLATRDRRTTVGAASAAGVVLAFATMTRPDSLLVAALVGLTLLVATSRDELRANSKPALGFAAGFAVFWLPFTLWRMHTYGDFFPNTYYAKSANLWWPEQGLVYVRLFITELPLFAVAFVMGAAALWRGWRNGGAVAHRRLLSAWLIAAAFSMYVLKVGGGFMHSRLLLPALPFAWITLAESLWVLAPSLKESRRRALGVVGALVLITALVPRALGPDDSVQGIVDERAHYDETRSKHLERDASVIGQLVRDLPVRAAYIGGQARLVYRTQIPIAIEAETGLTDHAIAHQTLAQRGRVGHEKRAKPSYLVDQRRVHMVFGAFAFRYLGLEGYVPKVGVRLGHTTVFLASWDAPLMAELKKRGAIVPPFEEQARRILADPTVVPADQRQVTLQKIKRFWPDAPVPPG
ncbi:MAG: hypothetical protein KC502_10210 [Myxococcales bacterium]|nr:hypothetical protein [Myxococcales bacterium]